MTVATNPGLADTARARADARRYSGGAMVLHWLTAAAFAFQIGLGWRMAAPRGPQTFAVYQLHKSIGITILLLTLARIAWRLVAPPPPFPATMRPVERRAAHAVHILFYVLLLGLPLSGWLLVSSGEVAVPTFLYGTIPWPHVPGVAALSSAARRDVNGAAATSHVVMGWIALAAIALHVAGALKHQYLEPGGDLGRMVPLPRRWLGIAGVVLVTAFVGAAILGRRVPLAPIALAVPAPKASPTATVSVVPKPTPTPVAAVPAPVGSKPVPAPMPTASSDAAAAASTPAAASPIWKVRKSQSSLRFRTAWSQGPVEGGFGEWRAAISFDPAALDAATATVTIDMGSVTTADAGQQGALPGADWFAAAAHPTAVWRATGFRRVGPDRYLARGTLTLRGVSRPLALPFTLTIEDDVATMTGTASIDRTAFGVGQGDWAATSDLPALVTVLVAIKADHVSDRQRRP